MEKFNFYGLSAQDIIDVFNALQALGIFQFFNPFNPAYIPGSDDDLNAGFNFYGFQG